LLLLLLATLLSSTPLFFSALHAPRDTHSFPTRRSSDLSDGSVDFVRLLQVSDPRVRLIRLTKNSGLSSALAAGLLASRGRIIVTLDSDLQSDPADISALLGYLDRWDAACGWRQSRRDPWLKRVSSRIANNVRVVVLDDQIHDSACSLRAMHRRCVESL